MASYDKEPPAQPSVLAAILSEVQKTNMRLTTVEQRLGSLEDTVQTPSSSSSSGSAKYKRTVPTRVRVCCCIVFYLPTACTKYGACIPEPAFVKLSV